MYKLQEDEEFFSKMKYFNPLPPTIHKRSSYHSPIKYIDLLCLL